MGKKIGIDIEKVTLKIHNVKKSFLSDKEAKLVEKMQSSLADDALLLTKIWSAKEAVVKYLSSDLMDVFRNCVLTEIKAESLIFLNEKNNEKFIVRNWVFEDFVFSLI